MPRIDWRRGRGRRKKKKKRVLFHCIKIPAYIHRTEKSKWKHLTRTSPCERRTLEKQGPFSNNLGDIQVLICPDVALSCFCLDAEAIWNHKIINKCMENLYITRIYLGKVLVWKRFDRYLRQRWRDSVWLTVVTTRWDDGSAATYFCIKSRDRRRDAIAL